MINVLYITSESHSGSTLLSLILGSHSRVFAPGELKAFSRHHVSNYIRKYRPDLTGTPDEQKMSVLFENPCTCGVSPIRCCSFWQQVAEHLDARYQFRLGELDVDTKDEARFIAENVSLCQTIQSVSGADWIVDASKTVRRLLRLRDIPELNIVTIHLIRHPCGVVYSNCKQGHPWRTALRNYRRNERKRQRALIRFSHLVLRYEDLTRDPVSAVTRCMAAMGLDLEPRQMNWAEHEHHLFQGNLMRFNRRGTIEADTGWRTGLSMYQKLYVGGATLPLRLARYLH